MSFALNKVKNAKPENPGFRTAQTRVFGRVPGSGKPGFITLVTLWIVDITQSVLNIKKKKSTEGKQVTCITEWRVAHAFLCSRPPLQGAL